jgi:hypothetical protein
MAMVPHEQLLVKRMENKPFVLLGVNFDGSKEEQKKVEANKKISWRSWFDGRGGPIGNQWNIEYLPTIYVIDHKGIIRFKDVHDRDMDKAVDDLVKEMESGNKADAK